jgi:hypothetical protein
MSFSDWTGVSPSPVCESGSCTTVTRQAWGVPADRAAAPRTSGLRPRGAWDGFATGVVANAGQAHTPWRTRADCAAARAARHRVPGLEQLGVHAPSASDFMERWVGNVRRECLDRMLIVGRRQLVHVRRIYIRRYNHTRPHRALDLRPPDSAIAPPSTGHAAAPSAGQAARPTRRPNPRIRARPRMTSGFCTPRDPAIRCPSCASKPTDDGCWRDANLLTGSSSA